MTNVRLLVAGSLACLASTADAKTIELLAGEDAVALAGKFSWFDEDVARSVEQLVHDEIGFRNADLGQLKIGRPATAVWVRFDLANIDHQESSWILELWSVPTELATTYVFEGDNLLVVSSTGQKITPPDRTYYPVRIDIPRGARRTVLLRIESKTTAVAPVAIRTHNALAAHDRTKLLVLGGFFGIGAALLIYNLFLFFAMRDRNYLLYAIYSALTWGVVIGENGFVDIALGGHLISWTAIGAGAVHLAALSALAFTGAFLAFHPRHLRLAFVLNVSAATVAFTGLARELQLGTACDLALVFAVVSMIAAALERRARGYRPATYYLIAWTFFFALVLVWIAESHGVVGSSLLTRYAVEVGLAGEMLLMSLALAERVASARAQALATLKTAHQHALDASELKAQFLAKVGHELRTPLHHIMGLNALLQTTKLDDEQNEYAGDVAVAAEELQALIARLLDLSELDSGRAEISNVEMEPAILIQEVMSNQQRLAERKRLALFMETDTSTPRSFRGDPARLQRLLMELVGNAIKFTESGEIRISSRLSRAGRLRLEVSDSGAGIAPVVQEKLFAPFSQGDDTLKRRFGGAGIGLALARRNVEQMGGTLGLISREGVGSTFWVELPVAPLPRASLR